MEAPIFIVGANRSGTTLLRLILNAHSRIAIPEELTYFNSFLAGVPIERWREPGLSPQAYAHFVSQILENNFEPLEGVDFGELRRAILEAGPPDFRRPYQGALEHWMRLHNKKRWGEKTPGNLFYADILLEMFPDGKFIHLIRDPRAGVCSMLETSFCPNDVVFNALARHKYMSVGRRIFEQSVPSSQRIAVKYEDLVVDPVSIVKRICDFVDERYEPEMLRFHEDAYHYMKPEAKYDFNVHATRPISTESTDKWRYKLNSVETAIIESICWKQMIDWGYELECHALRLGDRLHIASRRAYWKYQCARNRNIRHFTVQSRMFARSRTRLRNLGKRLARTKEEN